MNDMTKAAMNTSALTKVGDSFDDVDDGGGSSPIKGDKIKYGNDDKWINAKTGEVIPPTRELLVAERIKGTQKWIDDKPAETRILATGEHFPDIERLNAEAPPEEWTEKFGTKRGPWQNVFFVYLLDPKTLEGFTWPTSTAGGFRAVSELTEHVRRARMLQGAANIFPVVTLFSTHMNTRFGGRQRPRLEVVRFITLGGQARPLLEQPKPEPLNDAIPF
jgi:hypothetical protein